MSLLNPNQPPDLGVKPGDDVPAFPVTTTLVANQGFEEHPESLRPRVFLSVVQGEPGLR